VTVSQLEFGEMTASLVEKTKAVTQRLLQTCKVLSRKIVVILLRDSRYALDRKGHCR
jgi:hypothetical protein